MSRIIISTVVLLLGAAVALATEVYDNFETPADAIRPLLPAGAAASEEHGTRVALAPGIERAAAAIHFRMRIEGAGVATFQYRVRFDRVDGAGGAAGTPYFGSNSHDGPQYGDPHDDGDIADLAPLLTWFGSNCP